MLNRPEKVMVLGAGLQGICAALVAAHRNHEVFLADQDPGCLERASLGEAEDATADGGVIFAWGDTNIDDGNSELHQRHQIGIISADGYFSMNTGKLTSAPYFAGKLGDLLA